MEGMELEQLQGQVLNVVFRNEKNQYTVLVLQREDDGEEATVVGIIPLVSEGEELLVYEIGRAHV